MSEFKPHDYFMVNSDEYTSRKVFQEHVRKTYDQIRELADYIGKYEGTIDTEFTKIVNHVNEHVNQLTDLYNDLLDNNVLDSEIQAKLTQLEQNYAPRLNDLTAQLQQAVGAVTEDSEVVLARNEYTTLKERLDAEWDNVNAQLADKANKAQEAWITPTLVNGWVTESAVGTPVQYMKDSMGFVHLKGFVKNGTTNDISQLPAGYRPRSREDFAVRKGVVYIDVYGNIIRDSTVVATTELALSGIIFQAKVD